MPLFRPRLDTFFDCFEFAQVTEYSLNVLQVFLAQYHEYSVVELDNSFTVDNSRCIGKVLEPSIGKDYLAFPKVGVLDIEVIGHLPKLLLGEIVKSLFSIADPAELVIDVQSADEVNEFDIGLIAHHSNRTV